METTRGAREELWRSDNGSGRLSACQLEERGIEREKERSRRREGERWCGGEEWWRKGG